MELARASRIASLGNVLEEELMRKLTLTLAAAACVGLAAPVFAAERLSTAASGAQLTGADTLKTDVSAAKKKPAKKKSTTSRKSWGG